MSKDVVIVGAGAAGCALAHRLSLDPDVEVLLLEAGPDERDDLLAAPARWPEAAGSRFDWAYRSTGQVGLGGRVVELPRGRVLGGSTCINAMIHAHPWPDDRQEWAPGWSSRELHGALLELEHHHGSGPGRGRSGPAHNAPMRDGHPLCGAFVEAAVRAGHAALADVNQPGALGAGWFDLSVRSEERVDAATAYLRGADDRPNLRVRSGTTVERILLDGHRACGLQLSRNGVAEVLEVTGDLVLCAGAVGSPALLLRSGIGPGAELEAVGIECVVEAPRVGENLHDHPMMPMIWSSEAVVPPGRGQLAESCLVVRSQGSDGPVLSVAFAHVAVPHPAVPPAEHGATALIGLYEPRSRGRLRLDPADPSGPPLIDPALLTDPRDVEALVQGVAITREVARQPALAGYGLSELLPGREVTDAAHLAEVARASTSSYGHLAGTCALGPDRTLGVVDPELRVHGTDNVRVADASVIPTLPAVAPSATVQAIGWRAAELIARARPRA